MFLRLLLLSAAASVLLWTSALAQTQTRDFFDKRARYTVLISAAAMTADSMSMMGRTILTADLMGSDPTRLLPNASTRWRTTGFPTGDEVRYHGSRRDAERQIVEFEFRSDRRYYKFRVPADMDGNVALAPLLSPYGRNDARTTSLIEARMSEIAQAVFTGRLAGVAPDAQLRLLAAVHRAVPTSVVRVVERDGHAFVGLDLAEEGLVYNSIQFSPAKRLARVIHERTLAPLRTLAPELTAAGGIAGIAVTFRIRSQDFLKRDAFITETVVLYGPSAVLADYARGALTPQAFLDLCTLVVDDVQTAVDLSLR